MPQLLCHLPFQFQDISKPPTRREIDNNVLHPEVILSEGRIPFHDSDPCLFMCDEYSSGAIYENLSTIIAETWAELEQMQDRMLQNATTGRICIRVHSQICVR